MSDHDQPDTPEFEPLLTPEEAERIIWGEAGFVPDDREPEPPAS